MHRKKKKTRERNQSPNSKSVYINLGDFDVGFQCEVRTLVLSELFTFLQKQIHLYNLK